MAVNVLIYGPVFVKLQWLGVAYFSTLKMDAAVP